MQSNENYIKNRERYEAIETTHALKAFLRHAKDSYVYLHHFTDLGALKGIIEKQRWKFGPLDRMNDKMETEKNEGVWENRVSASYSHGDEDNIGMWKMYGEDDGNKILNAKICITLPLSFFHSWLKGIKSSSKIQEEIKAFFDVEKSNSIFVNTDKPIKVSMYDMVYYYGYKNDKNARLIWENNYKKMETKSLEKIIAGQATNMIGYIKNSAWEYERETRITIEAPKDCRIKRIKDFYVTIDDDSYKLFIRNVKVTLSPFSRVDVNQYKLEIERLFKSKWVDLSSGPEPRCIISFFKSKVREKDSSRAPYQKECKKDKHNHS